MIANFIADLYLGLVVAVLCIHMGRFISRNKSTPPK